MPDSSLKSQVSNLLLYGRHVLDALAQLPSESVHCIVTSPPYWGLRNYGTEPQLWPPAEAGFQTRPESCQHHWQSAPPRRQRSEKDIKNPDSKQSTQPASSFDINGGQFCSLCGSWRGELGLEPTPELYVQHLTLIFRECRRVLRSDGTLWLNLGDTYSGSWGNYIADPENPSAKACDKRRKDRYGTFKPPMAFKSQVSSLKSKDLVGIPWMVAFALRADGWYLRQEIIWHKPNPMPESVTDRCTKSHESLFLFSKSGTSQYWTHRDGKGTRQDPEPDYRWKHVTGYETAVEPPNWRTSRIPCPKCNGLGFDVITIGDGLFDVEAIPVSCKECDPETHTVKEWSRINLWEGHDYFYDHLAIAEPLTRPEEADRKTPARFGGADKFEETFKQSRLHSGNEYAGTPTGTRNRRSVWTIATVPYPQAHYAVFPPELPRLCILAGTSAHGCCPHCSAPYQRIIETNNPSKHAADKNTRDFANTHQKTSNPQSSKSLHRNPGGVYSSAVERGWQPTCDCLSSLKSQVSSLLPAVVLDPFAGSGTTLAVAAELGRNYIGIELDERNRKLTELRLARTNQTLNMDIR